jgi:hypothetical protein
MAAISGISPVHRHDLRYVQQCTECGTIVIDARMQPPADEALELRAKVARALGISKHAAGMDDAMRLIKSHADSLQNTPPADEELPDIERVFYNTLNEAMKAAQMDNPRQVSPADFIRPLMTAHTNAMRRIKSHAEQEKAAAGLEARTSELNNILKLPVTVVEYDDIGSQPCIRTQLIVKRLAELRDGDKVSPPLPEGDGKA